MVSPTVGLTDERLGPLGQAGKQSQSHERQIGHHAVGCHPNRTGSPEHQGVIESQHHAGGKLIEKGGAAQACHIGQGPDRGRGPAQPVLIPTSEAVERGETQPDYRSGAGGQSCPENTHI